MNKNLYDEELLKLLGNELSGGLIKNIGESAPIFAKLMKAYPYFGSKIDWIKVPGSLVRTEHQESKQLSQFSNFFDEVIRTYRLDGEAVYVGDSATDLGFSGTICSVRNVLEVFLGVPQHHYFTNSTCSWCMCLTMEGDMGFGIAPRKAPDTESAEAPGKRRTVTFSQNLAAAQNLPPDNSLPYIS